MKIPHSFIWLTVGFLVSLVGLFLIAYTGDSASERDIFINLRSRIDSDFVGVPLLIVGLIILAGSLLALRRSRIP
jgi:hypothetical protein